MFAWVIMLCSAQQGLEKHGVGKWGDICTELLPRWDEQAVRVKAARLLGSQSLARYVGWKGNRYNYLSLSGPFSPSISGLSWP